MKTIKLIRAMACIAILCAAFYYAGQSDWTQDVIDGMNNNQYELVRKNLGGHPTEYMIAQEYMNHKNLYR